MPQILHPSLEKRWEFQGISPEDYLARVLPRYALHMGTLTFNTTSLCMLCQAFDSGEIVRGLGLLNQHFPLDHPFRVALLRKYHSLLRKLKSEQAELFEKLVERGELLNVQDLRHDKAFRRRKPLALQRVQFERHLRFRSRLYSCKKKESQMRQRRKSLIKNQVLNFCATTLPAHRRHEVFEIAQQRADLVEHRQNQDAALLQASGILP
jgi:hypothetical protein